MTLQSCALVLLGGFLGGLARMFVSNVVSRRIGEAFPWGTLVVNISGALAIGVLAGIARRFGGLPTSEMFRDLVFIGFLGGYTTVSSFALQTLVLAREGRSVKAVAYVVLSGGLCVAAVAAGFSIMVRLWV